MLVSGGKLLAISKVKADGVTVSGDGVTQPLGIHSDYKVDASSYSVESGTPNVVVGSAFDSLNKHTTYTINVSADDSHFLYHGSEYIGVDNANSAIELSANIVASASSGYEAMRIINASAGKWAENSIYEPGPNIDIDASNVVSGRDWTPELDRKLDISVFSTHSANWNSVSSKLDSAEFHAWQDQYNAWSADVAQSAGNLSAYIDKNEEYWVNSSYNIQTSTPGTITISSAYDSDSRTVTYTVSAKPSEGKVYHAGEWIDKDELDNNGVIQVSGYKMLMTQAPLYFSADNADPERVWLLYEEVEKPKTKRACVVCNGWAGGDKYESAPERLEVVVPASPLDGEPVSAAKYTFKFHEPMSIQININAKFVAKEGMDDSMGVVGFEAVTDDLGNGNIQTVTNRITYSMLGMLKEQYYAASTITYVGPDKETELYFNFIGDTDFLDRIEYPCISINELVGEV